MEQVTEGKSIWLNDRCRESSKVKEFSTLKTMTMIRAFRNAKTTEELVKIKMYMQNRNSLRQWTMA